MAVNSPSLIFICLILLFSRKCHCQAFQIKEATIDDIQLAFKQNRLTSRQLVTFYLEQIRKLNPILKSVIEVNPDALHLADKADFERKTKAPVSQSQLHGIPILLKDNIATKDKLNTTAGSFALLGAVAPRDAGVVARLRKAGAIVLGKAGMTEWAAWRTLSPNFHNGWCARTGQEKNPYKLSADPCGSSTGSAISVAANMVAVSLGTDTAGSIICPSSSNSIVGIRPTVGLTSRAGVIPISARQDSVGPMCRTVADAVYVLDAIVGFDSRDEATRDASKYIPRGGYNQFLNANGLKGKRLGIVRDPFFNFGNESHLTRTFNRHFMTLRQAGAVLVDNLEFPNINNIGKIEDTEVEALNSEFKIAINAYLKELIASPVRSLADLIAFNKKHSKLEKTDEYGQSLFLAAQATAGIDKEAVFNLSKYSRDGFEKLMLKNKLDAWMTPFTDEGDTFATASILAMGQYPGISVPAGYYEEGVPFGICFGGLKGTEPKLIEIAYAFEQATKIRKPPSFKP